MNLNKRVVIGVMATVLIGGAGLVVGDNDRDGDEFSFSKGWFGRSGSAVEPVPQGLYKEECGSCHFPYQASLLPVASWETIMGGLEDHFGESAELDEADLRAIRNYLLTNAAGRNSYRISNKIMRSLQGEQPPLRITETSFFRREHRELPRRIVTENAKVGSFSNCDACHRDAMGGSFNEHQVQIPGYPGWED